MCVCVVWCVVCVCVCVCVVWCVSLCVSLCVCVCVCCVVCVFVCVFMCLFVCLYTVTPRSPPLRFDIFRYSDSHVLVPKILYPPQIPAIVSPHRTKFLNFVIISSLFFPLKITSNTVKLSDFSLSDQF